MKDPILALDQATQSGWAVGDEKAIDDRKIESGIFKMPKRPFLGERLVIFRTTLNELIDFYKPRMIAFERPYWPQRRDPAALLPRLKAAIHKPAILHSIISEIENDHAPQISAENLQFLTKVEGMIEEAATARGLPYEAYASSSWRVTAIGYGRAPKGAEKDHMKKAMVARAKALGYKPNSDDEADAIGILLHALTGEPAMKRAQGDLLAQAGALI